MPSISETGGTEPGERELDYPCDQLIERPEASLYRGVTIEASSEVVFRWLCQMRAAPYSYDWIDNCCRQSPRELTPGLDNLVVGQDVMGIFDLVEFERNRHLEALHDVRGTIAQLQRNNPDLDLDILATELTYWDPELEKRYPDITDWSVMP